MKSWFKAALTGALGLMLLLAPPVLAGQPAPPVPTQSATGSSEADLWQAIRQGAAGTTTLPNPRAGVLIQSDGEAWRHLRNGPIAAYGTWALGGIVGLLALFFLLRGRIRIDGAKTGRTVERFNLVERAAHWLTAGSFIVLALTGLNLLYGRAVLLPLIGPAPFAALAGWGKLAHNYLGFAFIAGVALIFLMWVRHNLPDRTDAGWVLRAGGLFTRGVHPPARKFNAGQKVIFWSTVGGGAVLGFTGVQLLFPFSFGTLADMQLYQLVHAGTALALAVVIIAHIYIGSLGMEGAFAAMGSGQVEEQWAREHHALWVAEIKGEPAPRPHHAPAAPAE
ncbi:MAG TPA: formate dehydrogenase subunit gamma [Azospirillum sp.]